MATFPTVSLYSKTSEKTKNDGECSNENINEDSALLNSTVELNESFIRHIIGPEKSNIDCDKYALSDVDDEPCKDESKNNRSKGATNYCELDDNSDNSFMELSESDVDEDYSPKRSKLEQKQASSVSDKSVYVKKGRPGRPKGSKNGCRKSEKKHLNLPKKRGRPKGSKNTNQANQKIVVSVDDNENCPKENDSESATINGGTGVTSPVKKSTKTSRIKVRNPDQWERNVKKK